MTHIIRSLASPAALALLAACAARLPDVSPDHPANPDAAQAAPWPASATLALDELPNHEKTAVAPATAKMTAGAYPLSTCIVSGKQLGSMGSPVIKVYDGREVRLCCPACVAPFEADKAGYLKKLDEALATETAGHGGHEGVHDHAK